jgi:hypothetical protein
MASTIRFSAVTAACGTPEVYLPLTDPRHDKQFMRAVKEQRVVTVKQEPTGTKKDFGVFGFLEEKYVTYLVFPKSLKRFGDKRIVGIKYEELQRAPVATAKNKTGPVRSASRKRPSLKVLPTAKPKSQPPAPPKPKEFTARIRLTAVIESTVTVKALTAREAHGNAIDAARQSADFTSANPQVSIISLEETNGG